MPQSLYELEIWKNGYRLALEVYRCSAKFPESERFSLTDQVRRSANSIIANIAESQGRYSYNDKIRVLYQSRGELFETRSHLKIAEGLGYISETVFKKIDQEYENLLIRLNAYIKRLSGSRNN